MTTKTDPLAGASTRRPRALAVLAGVVAAFLVWLVTAQLIGVNLRVRMGSGSGASKQGVGVAAVLIASLIAGLAAWALLGFLERSRPDRARKTWTVVVLVLLVLSLAGPLGAGVGAGAKLSLACMHLVTAAVLIPALARTSAGG